MLETMKLLLGLDASKDTLLQVLLTQAQDEAIDYTNNENVSSSLIIQMAIYKYNRLGTEGLNSENYSGLSFNYMDDYPETIVRQLKRFKRLGVVINQNDK